MAYIGLDSVDEHLSRIENRVRKGGESADPEVVKARFESRWEVLNQLLPYCDDTTFYDNENGFRCVGRYSNQKMTVIEDSCLWFLEYLVRGYLNTCPAARSFTEDEKIELTRHMWRGR